MKNQRQGFRSTKPKSAQADQLQDEKFEINLTLDTHRKKKDVYCKIWYMNKKIFTEQTGKFPVQSIIGHRYIMVFVEIEENYINTEPMKI